ncbi:MAG TPA: DUF6600 domain-containing protein [Pyrinomonadaceae bacterium]|jgi:hypothetical protein|nr:DUF6600 domain-containing protein [Pyrinomonadaceae bacterium]
MRSARYFSKALLLLLIALCVSNTRAATATDDDDYPDEYDVTARVVRVSLLSGDVSLRRAGNTDWERARLNLPLVEGDTLATGHDARLEIQIDSRNFLRVSEDSVLRLVTLRDEGIALSLTEGTATLRLARFDHDHEYFEIDAPKTTLAAEKGGLYRLDVSREGNVHLTVRDGGRARIYSENSGFTLRDGRTADLVYDGSNEPDWQLSKANAFDSWDDWVDQRERYLVQRLRYEQRDRYYDNNVWGAEELDSYGDWSYAGDYGWVWRPHITVINNYHDWAPYRYGHWTWCPPYGWTWVGDEAWGWAPYHYGRWVYYNNNWCWAPRGYGYHYSRAWWRPALVAFVYIPTSYGEHVAWYPLGYGQHDPHSRRYQQNKPERLTALRSNDVARLERVNPAALRAVTTLPARNFGVDDARMQPATTEIARRAIAGDPVRGRLPIVPANGAADNNGNGAAGPITGRPMRPARGASASLQVPAATLPERPTGAAARRPGAPLDDELRRTRLYNGREPRDVSGGNERNSGGSGTQDVRDRDTGAVTRPARPGVVRPTQPRVPVTNDGSERGESRERRPMQERRPMPDAPQQEQPSARPPQSPGRITGPDRPTEERPVESERPARPGRREPVDRPQPVERPEPERHERQERVEPPARHESSPRPEPPQRSEPAPSRPEPRHEEPPQHREQPAPSRPADPPREKSEPPRERERNDAPARPSRTSTKDPE